MGTVRTFGLLMLLFAVMIAIIHPFGEVLYGGDDWNYAWSAWKFATTGALKVSDWVLAPAIPQIIWGALFLKIFGFKLSVLNLSTMIIAIFGIFLYYQLLKELGFKPKSAGIVAIFTCATPLYVGFSLSFMSDMFYCVSMITATFFYMRAIKRKEVISALLASIAAVMSILSRQIGIVIVFSFFIVLSYEALTSADKRCRFLPLLIAGTMIPLLVLISEKIRPDFFGGRSMVQDVMMNPSIMAASFFNIKRNILRVLLAWNYLLILVLPLLILILWQAKKEVLDSIRKHLWLETAIVLVFICAILAVIVKGIPLTIRGDLFHVNAHGATDIPGSLKIWTGLSLFTAIPTAIILGIVFEKIKRFKGIRTINSSWLFIMLSLGLHVLLTVTYISFFNNYLLPLLPLSTAVFSKILGFNDWKIAISVPLLLFAMALQMAGSVLPIENHIRHVEASWKKADEMTGTGIKSGDIYAWPSWQGWRNYQAVIDDLRTNIIKKKRTEALDVFGRFILKSRYFLTTQSSLPRSEKYKKFTLSGYITYRTLTGAKKLYVWTRTGRKSYD